jgi:hypothetical protein
MQMIRRYFPIQSGFPHERTRSRRTVSSWSRRCQESEFGRRSAARSLLLWVPGWHTCGQSGKFAAASSAYDGFCRVVKCKQRLMSAVERHTAAGGRPGRRRGNSKRHSKTCQTESGPRANPPFQHSIHRYGFCPRSLTCLPAPVFISGVCVHCLAIFYFYDCQHTPGC